mmetsp:Transcript_64300/g.155180  ORF Transcript_64300/g.155180 Transcript_64300/m.155180 type:complete len:142 (+) Transcript_64300:21-446(+)
MPASSRMLSTFMLALLCSVEAFAPAQFARSAAAARAAPMRTAPVMQFGKKKLSPEEKLEEQGYWPGEWLCADCGYIYEPGTSPAFEELRAGWKCPQCAGPRRRFIKKAGDMLGTLDDTPLFLGTAGAFVLIFGLVYLGLTV